MANKTLVDYIRNTTAKGFTLGQVKDALLKAGHPEEEIASAIAEVFPKDSSRSTTLEAKLLYALALLVVIIAAMSGFYFYGRASGEGMNSLDRTVASVVLNVESCTNLAMEQRDWCYLKIAKDSKQYSNCMSISQYELRDFCITMVGKKIECDKIADSNLARECYTLT